MIEKIDKNGIKFNQILIVLLVSVSFITNNPWLLAVTSIIMIIGSIFPEASLFRLIYLNIIKPMRIMKPHFAQESNAPHLFAHGFGGIVLLISFIILQFINSQYALITGWSIALIVAVLAFINITLNFCTGCFIYFQLQKSGLLHSKSKESHA
ncbi:MAG TPA: DUF4395 domain-containing protein [Ignavibacteriaceae bacterium]|nr:DUF4395 domain-containing protein [Ignavibacteriaceae bacterium]